MCAIPGILLLVRKCFSCTGKNDNIYVPGIGRKSIDPPCRNVTAPCHCCSDRPCLYGLYPRQTYGPLRGKSPCLGKAGMLLWIAWHARKLPNPSDFGVRRWLSRVLRFILPLTTHFSRFSLNKAEKVTIIELLCIATSVLVTCLKINTLNYL